VKVKRISARTASSVQLKGGVKVGTGLRRVSKDADSDLQADGDRCQRSEIRQRVGLRSAIAEAMANTSGLRPRPDLLNPCNGFLPECCRSLLVVWRLRRSHETRQVALQRLFIANVDKVTPAK